MAGSLTVSSFEFTLPGITVTGGTISVAINTTSAAVTETVLVGGTPVVLNLPAGPTVTVRAIGVALAFGGHTLTGDFLFDQRSGVTRIAVANLGVAVTVGGNGATLSEGEGAFILTAAGLAGQASGKLNVQAGPIAAGGRALLRINTTDTTIDETIVLGTRTIAIKLRHRREEPVRGLRLRPEPQHRRLRLDRGRRHPPRRHAANGTAAQIFAGTGLSIFIGLGPAKLANGELNPLAVGAMIIQRADRPDPDRHDLRRLRHRHRLARRADRRDAHRHGHAALQQHRPRARPADRDPGLHRAGRAGHGRRRVAKLLQGHGRHADRPRPVDQRRLRLRARGQRRRDDHGDQRQASTVGPVSLTAAARHADRRRRRRRGRLTGTLAFAVPRLRVRGRHRPASIDTAQAADVRFDGTGVKLKIGGQELTGDFSFERATLADGTAVTAIAARNISYSHRHARRGRLADQRRAARC